MASNAQEILHERLMEEFEQTYTENDIFHKYCEEYEIIPTENMLAEDLGEHYDEFKEILFEEFKEMRLE